MQAVSYTVGKTLFLESQSIWIPLFTVPRDLFMQLGPLTHNFQETQDYVYAFLEMRNAQK